ncbi:SCO family protein [Psychrobacillus sp.]|uniref:SCO family protein n=1 Tax=Psychrobacillus sp. TaxID=1871623 RepID=UPI0028BEC97F|nr:SCO family protein [Psychrobacillus sp.]
MRKPIKNTRKVGFLLLICSISFVLFGCEKDISEPLNWELSNFSATNEDGDNLELKDLKGKVWIADFVFTNCTSVCPPMTANMKELQGKLKEKKLDVELVSFSVDPSFDTPEILKEYVGTYDGDLSNWTLLTGYDQQFIDDYALKNFKTIVKKPTVGDQVIHGTSFYLIDQNGIVKKDYDGLNLPFEEIIQDIEILLSKTEK